MGDTQHATQNAPKAGASQHELLGMPRSSRLVERHGSEGNEESAVVLAMDIMANYSELTDQDGKTYRVSIGNEHFKEYAGEIDAAYRDDEKSLGFRLYQEFNGFDADKYNPIYLVANKAVRNAPVTLNPSTRSIAQGILSVDEETVDEVYELVGRIKADCIDRQEEAAKIERQETVNAQSEKSYRRKRRWKTVGKLALTATLLAGTIAGATVGRESYNDWRASEDARAAAEAQAEVDAAQAKIDAADEVARKFDQAYDIQGVEAVKSGQTAIPQATDQFNEATVPVLGASTMSKPVANDITEPRAIPVDSLTPSQADTSCKNVRIRHSADDTFYVTHNGDPDAAMIFRLDAETDNLQLCYFGNMGPGGEVPSQVYIQKDTPPR